MAALIPAVMQVCFNKGSCEQRHLSPNEDTFNNHGRHAELVPKPDEIAYVSEGVVNLSKQINLEVDSDDVQELLDSHNQERTINELIAMHEKEQKKLKFLDPLSEDRMTIRNLTECLG
ncbi:hypothetical protein TNCV_2184451 [Trichonephila clavipes]|nr:hypothetical protein TNCV_2184451 [Trichonephila clavipes]